MRIFWVLVGRSLGSLLAELDAQYSRCEGVEIREISIEKVHQLYLQRKLTVRKLVECYLERIRVMDVELRSVLEINPDAQEIADEMDFKFRAEGTIKLPLLGIPVLVKDNIGTADKMNTTAGSYALLGARPKEDADVIKRLRAAGAIILGKTNLSEFAGFRSSQMSEGWSSRGGQVKNPYNLRATPSGSSSGSAVAVAANLCVVALGTETDGSITSPSSFNAVVGLKPTVSHVSLQGVIPFAPTQDSLGPMARSVIDCFKVYKVIALSTTPTNLNELVAPFDQNPYLQKVFALEPMRLGVANKTYFQTIPRQMTTLHAAIHRLGSANVQLKYNLDLGIDRAISSSESLIVRHEFKQAIKYLTEQVDFDPKTCAPRSLKDIIDFNAKHPEYDPMNYGQDLLLEANSTIGSYSEIEKAQLSCRRSAQRKIQGVIRDKRLDAIILPSIEPQVSSNTAALAGYPVLAIPAGYSTYGVPYGLTLSSLPWEEEKLFNLAYRLEQSGYRLRSKPTFLQ